jgi:hypothetical protein
MSRLGPAFQSEHMPKPITVTLCPLSAVGYDRRPWTTKKRPSPSRRRPALFARVNGLKLHYLDLGVRDMLQGGAF